ncbi:MAG: 6-bladed beta-propeller [Geothermobacteraceae bacterium]
MRRLVPALLLVLGLVAGCQPARRAERLVWPPPPERARFEYIGGFASPYDLKPPDNAVGRMLVERDVQDHLVAPFGLAETSSGELLVVDQLRALLYRIDLEARTFTRIASQPQLREPLDITCDEDGNIYVADSGRVLVFDRSGRPLRTIGKGVLDHPSYLTLDRSGDLYVSDSRLCRIFVFDAEGALLRSFGGRGTTGGRLYAPQGLALDGRGHLYVADFFNARVAVFTTGGEYLRQIGRRGDEPWNFAGPRDLAFDSDGYLHVLDSRKHALMSFTADGQLLLVTGGGATSHPMGFGLPTAILIDNRDRVFVSERYNSRVSIWQYLAERRKAQAGR